MQAKSKEFASRKQCSCGAYIYVAWHSTFLAFPFDYTYVFQFLTENDKRKLVLNYSTYMNSCFQMLLAQFMGGNNHA